VKLRTNLPHKVFIIFPTAQKGGEVGVVPVVNIPHIVSCEHMVHTSLWAVFFMMRPLYHYPFYLATTLSTKLWT